MRTDIGYALLALLIVGVLGLAVYAVRRRREERASRRRSRQFLDIAGKK